MNAAQGKLEPMAFDGPGPHEEHRLRLQQGIFEIQACRACSRSFFYPRAICKFCGSADLAWKPPRSPATVYSTTVVRRKPQDGGDYNVAIIELQEGPRLMSRVEDMEPHKVHIGMAVEPRVRKHGDEPVLVFVAAGRPQDAAAAGQENHEGESHE
jgi:uncharacterized OB-fold protein